MRSPFALRARSLFAALLLVGCNTSLTNIDPEPLDGGVDQAQALSITPPEQSVTVNQQPVTARFSARLDGDVTATADWSLSDPAFGMVTAGAVTVPATLSVGGTVQVTARVGDMSGSARLNVKVVSADLLGPGVAGSATGAFTGTATGAAPQIVYPFNGAMLARNINGMRLMWRSVTGATLYRVVLDTPGLQQSIYLGTQSCPGGECTYAIDDKLWDRVARGSSGAVTVRVAATPGTGQPVGEASLNLSFSPENVRGGLYYFSTSQRGLLRLPFGGTTAAPFILGSGNPGQPTYCVGCHGVSRDGKKVAAVFGGGDGYAGIVQGNDPTKFLRAPAANGANRVWNFATFSPDGKRLLTAWNGQLALRDGDTGALIKTVDTNLVGGLASLPEWSPDGQSIAFVRVPPEGKIGSQLSPVGAIAAGDWLMTNAGDIAVLPYNNGAFAPAITVVPRASGSEYHFYPSFSPDSRWLVFNSARVAECASDTAALNGAAIPVGACASYDQTAARLRLVAVGANQAPIELSAATHLAASAAAWPKFTPFQQNNGRLVFFTFSAKFDYGFVVKQSVIRQQTNAGRPQLWMAAIDLQKAASGGGDPSFPPFWLPFQDSQNSNHEVLWTQDIACTVAADCGSETQFNCVQGVCVPKLG